MRRRGIRNWKSRGVFQKITTEQLDRRVSVCEVCGTCGGRELYMKLSLQAHNLFSGVLCSILGRKLFIERLGLKSALYPFFSYSYQNQLQR